MLAYASKISTSCEALGWMSQQSREHVGEPGLRVDVVEFAGLCRRLNYAEWLWRRPVSAAVLRAIEGTWLRCQSA
jgi:hypothetical protein